MVRSGTTVVLLVCRVVLLPRSRTTSKSSERRSPMDLVAYVALVLSVSLDVESIV